VIAEPSPAAGLCKFVGNISQSRAWFAGCSYQAQRSLHTCVMDCSTKATTIWWSNFACHLEVVRPAPCSCPWLACASVRSGGRGPGRGSSQQPQAWWEVVPCHCQFAEWMESLQSGSLHTCLRRLVFGRPSRGWQPLLHSVQHTWLGLPSLAWAWYWQRAQAGATCKARSLWLQQGEKERFHNRDNQLSLMWKMFMNNRKS